jgi:hypothetical protein
MTRTHEEKRNPALDLKQRFIHVHKLLGWPVVIAAELPSANHYNQTPQFHLSVWKGMRLELGFDFHQSKSIRDLSDL